MVTKESKYEEIKGGPTKGESDYGSDEETIKFLHWIELSISGGADAKRLFVLTNKGFYFLIEPQSKPCGTCAIESFCPTGPELSEKPYEWHHIKQVITFSHFPKISFMLERQGKTKLYTLTFEELQSVKLIQSIL
jgi:hypothetical protein